MSTLPRRAAFALVARSLATLAPVTLAPVTAALVACHREAAPAPTPKFPATVAFALDERVGIEGREIDEASVYVERLEPAASPAHLRRLALTNLVLPRHVARLLAPEAHAKAKADALAVRGALAAGSYGGPLRADGTVGEVVEGGFSSLGILPWGVALDLAEGEWSEVIEEVGTFIVLRRVARTDGPVPMATTVRVEAFHFPWLPMETVREDVDRAYDGHRLTVVDPAWADIPPASLLHRMQGRR
ncbi:MAG: hypothetical protein FJ298_12480 [Planctomycetes bacterium]|nr:hypothetical protein [Planctomycetota bacterium]